MSVKPDPKGNAHKQTAPTWKTITAPVEDIAKAGGELNGEEIPESTPKFEWHHIIPQALKGLEIIKQAIKEGFGFDEEENLPEQEKFSKSSGKGTHGNHPKYNNAIDGKLQEAVKSNPGASASDIVRGVANGARQTINNNPGVTMNDLFNINLLFLSPTTVKPTVIIGPLSPGVIIPEPPKPAPKPKPLPPPDPPKPKPLPPNYRFT